MPSSTETLLAQIRANKTCDLKQGALVTDEFISTPPHRVGILHLAMMPRFLLADPVGCGKTPQALVAFAYLKEKDPTLRMVVVTPVSSLFQWRTQTTRFIRKVQASVTGYNNRTKSKQSPQSRKWQWTLDKSDVLITTYHTLARDLDTILQHFDNFVLVLDEVQTVRGATTQTVLFPAAQRVSCKARYVWGLSATPLMSRLEDLFGVFEAVKPGLLGGNLVAFRKRYIREVYIKPLGRWKTVGHQRLDELKALIAPFVLKRPAEEIDQYLPPIVAKHITVTMGDKQRALYDQIKRLILPSSGLSTEESAVTLDAPLKNLRNEIKARPLTKFASLTYAQIAADAPAVLGFPDVPSAKWVELQRFLVDECANGEKVIVYSQFERVVTWLCAQLGRAGISHVRITGEESAKVREANRVRFQTQPTMRIMVIDSAGGQALDLQAAGIVLFFDLPWSWGEFVQVLGRARRIGSKHPKVLVAVLATLDSIDTSKLTLLNSKETLVDLTLSLTTAEKAISSIVAATVTTTTTVPVTAADSDLDFLFSSLLKSTKKGEERTEGDTLRVPLHLASGTVPTARRGQ